MTDVQDRRILGAYSMNNSRHRRCPINGIDNDDGDESSDQTQITAEKSSVNDQCHDDDKTNDNCYEQCPVGDCVQWANICGDVFSSSGTTVSPMRTTTTATTPPPPSPSPPLTNISRLKQFTKNKPSEWAKWNNDGRIKSVQCNQLSLAHHCADNAVLVVDNDDEGVEEKEDVASDGDTDKTQHGHGVGCGDDDDDVVGGGSSDCASPIITPPPSIHNDKPVNDCHVFNYQYSGGLNQFQWHTNASVDTVGDGKENIVQWGNRNDDVVVDVAGADGDAIDDNDGPLSTRIDRFNQTEYIDCCCCSCNCTFCADDVDFVNISCNPNNKTANVIHDKRKSIISLTDWWAWRGYFNSIL